jgi:6-phosphogluconate dehydrogenase
MRAAAEKFAWNLDYGSIALIWRGGCIIRSAFLNNIKDAFEKNGNLKNLMLDEYFRSKLIASEADWRKVVAESVLNGITVPALSAALSYYDAYKTRYLPANLLQGQRDYFGAHTYERLDRPEGEFFHTEWIKK